MSILKQSWKDDLAPARLGGGSIPPADRFDVYRAYADRLLAEGKAYYCTCTPEELEERRQRALAPISRLHMMGAVANGSRNRRAGSCPFQNAA